MYDRINIKTVSKSQSWKDATALISRNKLVINEESLGLTPIGTKHEHPKINNRMLEEILAIYRGHLTH